VHITRAPSEDEIDIPEPDGNWHPIAEQWYASLQTSGQRIFYENSDWAQAYYIADAMSRSLFATRFSGNLFAAVITATHELLTTEGARRRLRIELERATADHETGIAVAMAEYRNAAQSTH
jgi:hypothetical protein